MFYLGNLLRTIDGETASQTALRTCSKEVREEPGHTGVVCWKKHQKIIANHKKNRHLNYFTAFLYMGRCKSLGSLTLFPRYASLLSRTSLQSTECFLFSSIPEFPSGPTMVWGVGASAVADGLIFLELKWQSTFFVYWNGRQQSLSAGGDYIPICIDKETEAQQRKVTCASPYGYQGPHCGSPDFASRYLLRVPQLPRQKNKQAYQKYCAHQCHS